LQKNIEYKEGIIEERIFLRESIKKNREAIVNKIKLPVENIFETPKIIITGNGEITIENHKGIIAFEKDEIKINSKIGIIMIIGREFEILYIGGSTLTISGVFNKVIYEEKFYDK
jgi:sporulation protein YqfC